MQKKKVTVNLYFIIAFFSIVELSYIYYLTITNSCFYGP